MESNKNSKEVLPLLEVTTSDAANALLSEKGTDIIHTFMPKGISLTDAAQKLDMKLNTLLYQVNRLSKLGILQISGTRKQNGKTVKLYQTVAEYFAVPFELTSATTSHELITQIAQVPLESFLANIVAARREQFAEWVILIGYNHASDGLTISLTPKQTTIEDYKGYGQKRSEDPNSPVSLFNSTDFNLSFEDAKALENEMKALVKKYREKSTDGVQRYVAILGLVADIKKDATL